MTTILPEIDRVTWINTYRDGGSFSIEFDGVVGESYSLFFKVKVEIIPDRDFTILGYTSRLDAFYPYEYKSQVTGFVHSDSREESNLISWTDATILLERMRDLLDNMKVNMFDEPLTEDEREELADYYREMVAISNNQGKVSVSI